MSIVFICSPYAGDIKINTRKARRYCRFAYTQNKIPIAPHLIYPQFLNENIKEERESGIKMGLEILKKSNELWCFGNEISNGMNTELKYAIAHNIPIRYFTDLCEEVRNYERNN